MLTFIFRRLLTLIPLLLVVSILVFLILRLGENDPAMAYLRLSQIPPTDEALAVARESLGLNRPWTVQYIDWMWRALHLDFGNSYVTGTPVLERILYYLPTTDLDVIAQSKVLDLLESIRDSHGMAILLVTHDLGVTARLADDVAVMQDGQIIETGSAADIFEKRRHPYTKELIDAHLELYDTNSAVENFNGFASHGRLP